MCDYLKLNLGSFCHFDDERLAAASGCDHSGRRVRSKAVGQLDRRRQRATLVFVLIRLDQPVDVIGKLRYRRL
jgi:hypothetical protein